MSDAFLHDAESLADIARSLVTAARRRGASDAVAAVVESRGVAVALRQGLVQSRSQHRGSSVSLTVFQGRRQGSAHSTDLAPARHGALVEAALAIAAHTADDPFAGPAAPDQLSRHQADLDLLHPWSLSGNDAIELARRLEAGIASGGPEVRSDGAWVSSHQEQRALAVGTDFCRSTAQSVHSLAALALARRGSDRQRDHATDQRRAAADLATPEALGAAAARGAVAALATRQLITRQAPVLFDARSACSLLGHLVQATSGRTLLLGGSFLHDRLDRPLFADAIDVVEDPWLPRGMASALFDPEGVAARPRPVVEAGVLRGWFLSLAAARQLGTAPTGHAGGACNLRLRSRLTTADDTFARLLERLDTGLLVTGLTGDGVRLVDGDYSRGARGFWVERGEVSHAVERITISGNLRDLYAGIQAVGNDLRTEGAFTTGSVLVDRMQIAGS